MSARGTTIAQAFSNKLLKEVYDRSLLNIICNRDYEGEINQSGSVLNMLNIGRISEKTYANAAMSADSLTEKNSVLTISEYKSFYWKEKTLENWLSYVKNPHPTVVTQKADERNRNMDLYAFGMYGDVAAENRIGTDYTTGSVEIDASGNVSGNGTTFSASMVGKAFKALGHTATYRVKTYTNPTTIVIEDDLDDVASQYTGGAIVAGATYAISAVTAVTVTTANLLDLIAEMKLRLDIAEKNGKTAVPDSDRWLIVPPEFAPVLVKASGIALHVPEVYTELVKQGMITMLQGFKVFQSNRLSGDNTDGYHILAGHNGWLTFAEKLLSAEMEEDLPGDFGTAYKDLFVYGGKVADPRRHFAVDLFAKF